MIKQITVAECDICGATEKAKMGTAQYNETIYEPPKGWIRSGTNNMFLICPKCWEKLGGEKK